MNRLLIIVPLGVLVAALGISYALTRNDVANVAIYQTDRLITVGDAASICVVAHYRDGSVRLGRVAQQARLTAEGIKVSPRTDTAEVRARCASVLQTLGAPLSAALVDVQWTTSQMARQLPLATS